MRRSLIFSPTSPRFTPGRREALPIRRTVAIAPLLAFAACATESGSSRSELTELRAEVRALRESNKRLERRMEQLEAERAVAAARSTPAPARPASPAAATPAVVAPEVPELTVVKLKPKVEPAPRIDVSIPIVEPSPELIDSLATAPEAAPAAADAEPADLTGLEGQFNAGLEAVRTGNVEGGVQRLIAFAKDNPRHPKADNALYFAGLGQMGLSDYAAAARLFEQLVSSYPAGDAVVEAMLKLAECRVRLNRPKDARVLYGEVISRYPGTTAASQAEARLSALSP